MPRFAVLLSIVLVVLGSAVALTRPATSAQEASPTASTTHPVVGLWRTAVSNTGDAPFTSLSTFHADGTYTEVLPDGLTLSGVWEPTGERTASVTTYVNYFVDDRLVEGNGPLTVEVDESGDTLTEEGTFTGIFADDGSVALAVESPATGVRLGILPVEPLGMPVVAGKDAAGTPTP